MRNNSPSRTKVGIGLNRTFTIALLFTVIVVVIALVYSYVFKKYPKELILTKDTKLEGITFPAGSHIYFSGKSIESVILSNPLTIQNIKCQKHVNLGFYPSGKVRYTYALSEYQEIQGVPCAKDIEVSFYESGRLHTAGLGKGWTIQDIFFPARSELFFYESGKLEGARLSRVAGPFNIHGISCDTCCEIYFHESGTLMSATLSQDQEIGGKFYRKGTDLRFDENEKVL